jgi:hypothetical protein
MQAQGLCCMSLPNDHGIIPTHKNVQSNSCPSSQFVFQGYLCCVRQVKVRIWPVLRVALKLTLIQSNTLTYLKHMPKYLQFFHLKYENVVGCHSWPWVGLTRHAAQLVQSGPARQLLRHAFYSISNA